MYVYVKRKGETKVLNCFEDREDEMLLPPDALKSQLTSN